MAVVVVAVVRGHHIKATELPSTNVGIDEALDNFVEWK